MAFLEDKISEIRDPELRNIIQLELKKLKSEKKFGLVFEEHLPELAPIYNAPIRPGDTVAVKNGPLTETYAVVSVAGHTAALTKDADGSECQMFVDELVVVKHFGEAIYPALLPLSSVTADPAAPRHTLIEADNYHALQLLAYAYAGQVDVIYIDPPYNTGARDWKYNNRYVDGSDSWRHSKWLSMMKKRLLLAKRLLNPDTGVLIVTIDEHEVHHLGVLLENLFPEAYRQLVTIVITSRGVAKQGLARVEEHALFTYIGNASAALTDDDFLTNESTRSSKTPWASLLRRGTNATPIDRPGLVYPIYLDPDTYQIINVGETLAEKVAKGELERDDLNKWHPVRKKSEAWPIRSDGSLGTWQVNPTRLMALKNKGFVKLGRFDESRVSWAINYLKSGPLGEIKSGKLIIKGYEWEGGPAILEYADEAVDARRAKTVWYRTTHDAGTYGSNLLRNILGNRSFEFPKSLYAVRDTLSTVTSDNKTALILDFFAGSGSTLHATLLLNAADGGQRRCILVTNNEVSEEEARRLSAQGYQPNDPEWAAQGICRSVTFPRCKYVIQGRRDDGAEIDGDYLTGRTVTKEKNRTFRKLGFIAAATLNTAAAKKEVVSLIEGIPQSDIKTDTAFFVSGKHPASILFDEAQADAWLEALEDQDHISHFYIITASNNTFADLKQRITNLLGPLEVAEEEKRPMKNGFAANLEYFKLDFLEPHDVEMGRQFAAILPILWLIAGAKGPRPAAGGNVPWFIPAENPFAVLLDETQFRAFKELVEHRSDLSHIFLVTDSETAFLEMTRALNGPRTVMLYKSYLENFKINLKGVGPL